MNKAVNKKGVFITLEGGDGTGKTTQIKYLHEAISNLSIDVISTREPGGTTQAERIRNLLLQGNSGSFDPMTEALLMFASRREHLVDKIIPAIDGGQWVISDRFADSSRAFQGYGLGLNMEVIETLYNLVAGSFEPDLTLIFDIDPKLGLDRSVKHMKISNGKESSEDRYENMGLKFQTKLRQGFLEIAKDNPKRCVIIDASKEVLDIHREILDIINKRFNISLKEVL